MPVRPAIRPAVGQSDAQIHKPSMLECRLVTARRSTQPARSASPAWRLRSCSVSPLLRVDPLPPPNSVAVRQWDLEVGS